MEEAEWPYLQEALGRLVLAGPFLIFTIKEWWVDAGGGGPKETGGKSSQVQVTLMTAVRSGDEAGGG